MSETSQDVKSDDIFNYNCALLADGLFFMNFLDAIPESDGARMMGQYKYLLLYFRADGTHSAKYALQCLYQSFLVLVRCLVPEMQSALFGTGPSTTVAILVKI